MCVGLAQSPEGLNRTKTDLQEQKGICQQPALGLELHQPSLRSSLLVYPPVVLALPSLHSHMSQCLEMKTLVLFSGEC